MRKLFLSLVASVFVSSVALAADDAPLAAPAVAGISLHALISPPPPGEYAASPDAYARG